MISDLPPGTDDYEGQDSVLDVQNKKNEPNKPHDKLVNIKKFVQSHQIQFVDGTSGPMLGYVNNDEQEAFLCYPCEVTCFSEISLRDHLNGRKHTSKVASSKVWIKKIVTDHPYMLSQRKLLMENRPHTIPDKNAVKTTNTPPSIAMQYFDTMKVALIGLEYFVEILGDSPYDTLLCTLCNKRGVLNGMTNHLTSLKHRCKYFSIHFPTVFRKLEMYKTKQSNFGASAEVLNSICDRIEKDYGRQKLFTVMESDFSRNMSDYVKTAISSHHFSERSGKTYVEMVDDTFITARIKQHEKLSNDVVNLKSSGKGKEVDANGHEEPEKIVNKDTKDYNIKITLKTTSFPVNPSNEELQMKDLREDLNERRAKKDLRDEIDRISYRRNKDDEKRYSPIRSRDSSAYINPNSPYRSMSPRQRFSPRLRSPFRLRSPYRSISPNIYKPVYYPRFLRDSISPRESRSPRRLRSPFRSGPLRISRSPRRLRSPLRLGLPERSRPLRRSRSPLRSPRRSRSPLSRGDYKERSPFKILSSWGESSPLTSWSPERMQPTEYRSRSPRKMESSSTNIHLSRSPTRHRNASPRNFNRLGKSPEKKTESSSTNIHLSRPPTRYRNASPRNFNRLGKSPEKKTESSSSTNIHLSRSPTRNRNASPRNFNRLGKSPEKKTESSSSTNIHLSRSPTRNRNASPRNFNRLSKSPEKKTESRLVFDDIKDMPFAELRSMDLKDLHTNAKKKFRKANLFYEGLFRICENMKGTLEFHEKHPERHPLYEEEWKKFWNKRYKELKSENIDASSYNFKPEWILYWSQKIKGIHEEEMEVRKSELCRKLALPYNDKELKDFLQSALDQLFNYSKGMKNPPPIMQKILKEAEQERKAKVLMKQPKSSSPNQRQFYQRSSIERSRSGSATSSKRYTSEQPALHYQEIEKDFRRAPHQTSHLRSTNQDSRHASPISDDSLSDASLESFESNRKHKKVKRSREKVWRREPKSAPYTDIKSSDDVNVISVLRLLTALENYLGSLGSKVVDLLALALKMEKEKPNSSENILANDEHCVLFETVKEKLKGQLLAGLVDSNAIQATKKAIQYSASLVHMASKLAEEEKKKMEENKTAKESVPVTVEGIGAVEKAAIANQIATALIAQGRTDVSTEELESLVNAVVGMANKEEEQQKQPSGSKKDSVKKKETTDSTNYTANALQMLQSAYASQSAIKKKAEVLEEAAISSMEGLSDFDLQTLLQNFEDLSSDEQNGLIAYLKNLEKKDPKRVENLRKFVSVDSSFDVFTKDKSPLSMKESKSVVKVPAPKIEIKVVKESVETKDSDDDDDDDDYTFDDVLKSASAKVKESQLQGALEVVRQSINEGRAKEPSTIDISSITSLLKGSQQPSDKSGADKHTLPDTSYENISKVLGLVATLSSQNKSALQPTTSNVTSNTPSNDVPMDIIKDSDCDTNMSTGFDNTNFNNADENSYQEEFNSNTNDNANVATDSNTNQYDESSPWGRSQYPNNSSGDNRNQGYMDTNADRQNMMQYNNSRNNPMQPYDAENMPHNRNDPMAHNRNNYPYQNMNYNGSDVVNQNMDYRGSDMVNQNMDYRGSDMVNQNMDYRGNDMYNQNMNDMANRQDTFNYNRNQMGYNNAPPHYNRGGFHNRNNFMNQNFNNGNSMMDYNMEGSMNSQNYGGGPRGGYSNRRGMYNR